MKDLEPILIDEPESERNIDINSWLKEILSKRSSQNIKPIVVLSKLHES